MKNAVGVLGGLGPLATVYFMDMIIEMTDAQRDQDHINMLVSNHATIPDRTEFIMGASDNSPLNDMIEDARMLEAAGCRFLVIPCNTAHYFFEDIRNSVKIPVLNIVEETIRYAQSMKSENSHAVKRLGVLATRGTISSETYSFYGKPLGVECVAPDEEYQQRVDSLIYDRVKAGLDADPDEIMKIIEHMRGKGCDAIVMGCTELSVVCKDLKLTSFCSDVVDSLQALARGTVLRYGKKLRAC